MLESYYLADASVAQRAGVERIRYMAADGRYIVNDSDLRRIRLTAEEYVTGLPVELVSHEKAKQLIRENGYDLGGALTQTRSGSSTGSTAEAQTASASSAHESTEETTL